MYKQTEVHQLYREMLAIDEYCTVGTGVLNERVKMLTVDKMMNEQGGCLGWKIMCITDCCRQLSK